MGFFSGITGNTTEQRTQLMFFDDGSFKFRKMPFEDSCLVEKKDNSIVKAWKHFYSSEIHFDGYKNIRADDVTLGFGRDFILDPFNKVPVTSTPSGGKPKRDEASIRAWTKEVAESQRYKVMNKPGSMLLINKITIFLGVTLLIMVLSLAIGIASR